jgi:two-component system chemotaxis response regulator CheB
MEATKYEDRPGEDWARTLSSPQLVVMAASAGGLDAVRRVLSLLPSDFPAAIALLQHRAETFPDRLPELLSKGTRLRVQHAADGMPLEAGTVYVCPAGIHMTTERSIRLAPGPRLHYVRPNADLMFDSAARIYGNRAIGIILSGSGSDGAVGSLAIARAGGTVIVQTAGSCGFSDMPVAALRVGATDVALSPEEIAGALQQLVQGRALPPARFEAPPDADDLPRPATVLLVDDHRIVLEGLHALLDGERDIQVVAGADDGHTAVRRAAELSPDVVVMDICMPDLDGVEATRQILMHAPDAKVIALSSRSDATVVNRILGAGAFGYLTKQRASHELVAAIRTVMRHRTYFSPEVARLVANKTACIDRTPGSGPADRPRK